MEDQVTTLPEDPRKTGLKKGLRQLTIEQIERVLTYPHEMVLDEYNYCDGKFCPLAIGVGLDRSLPYPSDDRVYDLLVELGYSVRNTRGIEGEFYQHPNRLRDLRIAAQEVLDEKRRGEREGS